MSDEQRPLLRVVRGDPTAEEMAALVTVVAARAAEDAQTAPSRPTAWNDPARLVRVAVRPGLDGWRASARPS